MTTRLVFWSAVLVALGALGAGCGSSVDVLSSEGTTVGTSVPNTLGPTVNEDPWVPSKLFRVIDTEVTGLNGVENEDRPPTTMTLVGGVDANASLDSQGLLDAYRVELEAAGWTVERHAPSSSDSPIKINWWSYSGYKGNWNVRIGPAPRFVERGSVAEGYAPIKFGKTMKSHPEDLIVVSIEPS